MFPKHFVAFDRKKVPNKNRFLVTDCDCIKRGDLNLGRYTVTLKRIKWLASFPKSGNTWTRAFLRAYQFDAYAPIDANQIGKISRSESRLRYFQLVSDHPSKSVSSTEIDALRVKVQALIAREIGDHQVVKTHNARILHEGQSLIHDEYSAAGIYLVRNPLDLVDSLADHNGISIDQAIDLLADPTHTIGESDRDFAPQFLSTWSNHVESWLSAAAFPILLIRFEDLLSNPYVQFRRLIECLKWPYEEDRLQRAIKFSSFTALKQFEEQQGFKEKSRKSNSGSFFRRGAASIWQNVLTADQARRIVETHSETMRLLGYLDDVQVAPH